MREDPLRYSEPLVKVYEAIVDELLVALAKHFNVSAMGNTGSFDYEVMMLGKLGAIRKETAAIIARMAAGNEPMVEVAVKAAMLDALKGVEPELKAAASAGLLTDAPMDMVDGVQAQLLAYSRQAADQLNLVNTVMLDGTLQAYRKGVYQAKNILEQLGAAQEILNAQTGKVIVGSQSLQQAVRAGVAAMHKEGITGFVDRGGHRWSAEAYVRMDVQTTCSNAANQAVMTRNEQYGNDIVWARTNATARPGCYPWQGVLISMGNRELDVEDGDGRTMHVHPVSKTTYGQPDGIWGINCHHGPMNVFIPGLSYVRGEELKPDGETNRRLYELTQEQRKLERELRYAKREAAMLDAAGDREGFEAAALKVQARQEKLRAFVDEHESLRFEGDRVQVHGYGRKQAARVRSAVAAAERTEKASLDFTAGSGTIKMPKDPRFAELPTDVVTRSRQIHEILNDYTDRKSKWSGTTVVATKEELNGANGRKEWICDILLRDDSGVKTAIHEHLHARSGSYYGVEAYVNWRPLEEGSVEFFAQEICKMNGIPFIAAYPEETYGLRVFAKMLKVDDYRFAKEVFETPLTQRYVWLRKRLEDGVHEGLFSERKLRELKFVLSRYVARGGMSFGIK